MAHVKSGVLSSIDDVERALSDQSYIADRGLATAVFLALRLGKPLLLEGEAGVGKTEVAKALAAALGAPLLRLQGYEGIDLSAAVYEWNYARQIMAIRTAEARGQVDDDLDVFSPQFLIKRPILQALESAPGSPPPVLLIDELDRADDEFEAFLLEVLSDFQLTIPEIGTVRAERRPIVIITSNRTRELHDALKRRCLYHWIEYPSFDKECRVVAAKVPEAASHLQRQVVSLVQRIRTLDLYKPPGMAETLDWARGLVVLAEESVTEPALEETLGILLKNQEDIAQVSGPVKADLVETARRSP